MVISLTTLFLCLLLSCLAVCETYNVTVDDRFGDPLKGVAIAYGEGWFDSGLSECGSGCQSLSAFTAATNGKPSESDRFKVNSDLLHKSNDVN